MNRQRLNLIFLVSPENLESSAARAALKLIAGMVVWTALATLVVPFSHSFAADDKKLEPFRQQVLPLLKQYCADCHMHGTAEAGISFDRFEDDLSANQGGKLWLRVRDAIVGRTMPPPEEAQLPPLDLEKLTHWIENDFLVAQCERQSTLTPVVIRRLNRQEYDNTIRDLLGQDLLLAESFPSDDIAYGYDNVGSALNISPAHIEKFLGAAAAALEKAIVVPDAEGLPPIELIGLKTHPLPPDRPVEFKHSLRPGRYMADFSLVRVGIDEKVTPPRLTVGLGKDRRTLTAVRVQDETVVYRFWMTVLEGDSQVHVSLASGEAESTNVRKPSEVTAQVSGDQRYGNDRGLHVDSIVVRGPVSFPEDSLPSSHKALIFRSPVPGKDSRADCARPILGRFEERAFRRPVTPEEVDRVFGIFRLADERGESFERSLQLAMTAVLASPRFLFLVEPEERNEDRRLTEFELASRLSYFLWSSMPDETLFQTAREGKLRANLRSQVVRMLADPKSDALVENFTGQWLQLRKLQGIARDNDLFTEFDERLKTAMREETEHFFAYILRHNRSVLELLDSSYTFMNERLAKHYGVEGVTGGEFRRVDLADRRRGGVLTHASVLTLTSNPNRTSPVKRGQWILQQLLGTPPPPPPADVAKLDESREASDIASLRDRMELHRVKAECATCHQQMDPLGFALENYDAVGRWRTKDGEFPIDASGELLGGQKFRDIKELKSLLVSTASKKFIRCLVENMLTYGLGRGLEIQDYCTVEEICKELALNENRIHRIILGIVESRAFQNRGISQ